MTLATRCPQCGTTFRVVSDQLKLRRGLVKCGRCQTVFNGVEKLHYIADEDVLQTTVIGASPAQAPPAAPQTPPPAPLPATPAASADFVAPPPDAPMVDPLRPDLPPFPAPLPAPTPAPVASGPVDPLSAVEPDPSLELPRDDQPPRRVLPDERTPFPQISSDLLNPRARANPFAVVPPATASDPVEEPPIDTPAAAPEAARHDDASAVEHHVGAAIPPAPGSDDEFDDAATRPPAPPLDEAFVRATQPRAHSPNLRNIFESEHGLDDLCEVPVETSGVLPSQRRGEPVDEADLGPLTLLDVANERELPQFLREPQRMSLGLRLALACACVLGVIGLLAQGAWVYRAELAADHPVLQPTLASLCSAIGPDCRIGLPRRIASLRVVSAELQATPQSGDKRYLLRFGLGNDSTRVQAWPDLELMLTDAHNQQVVRRVIPPDEYLGSGRSATDARRRIDAGLAPQAEEAFSLPVRVDLPEPVYGYVLGIFHP